MHLLTATQPVVAALLEKYRHRGVVTELVAIKQSERKDDPARIQNIHGPYEELTLLQTGFLPPDYYVPGDPQPWGLRVVESRRNVLWQVLAGLLDHQPDFAAAYMALALDAGLGDDNYDRELAKLNASWRNFWQKAGSVRGHHHQAMKGEYHRVNCPACSMLTALALADNGMRSIFEEMLPLSPRDRRQQLAEKGLLSLLDTMVPKQL